MLLDSNVSVVLGFIEHSSGPGVLLEGGVCGSSRAWVYQSKGIGMKGWETALQGCRRGSGVMQQCHAATFSLSLLLNFQIVL